MNELNHLAIIMDGNGRWAKNKGLLRSFGHKAGASIIKDLVKTCMEEGIKNLSLFAFSTENWKRPKEEVDFIFKLFNEYLSNQSDDFLKNGIRFKTFGNIKALDELTRKLIDDYEFKTKDCKNLNFNLGINYGAKDEIIRAVKKLNEENLEINEENLNNCLDINQDVDLLIRTGGHFRISNFLLWQCAYAELYFTKTLFPDFSPTELKKIIQEYKVCKRNFGGI